MRLAPSLTALFWATGCASNVVGTTIPPYPVGLIHKQGSCVGRSLGNDRICDYSIGILEDEKGRPITVFGARLAGRDAAKKAFWSITDARAYPNLPKGYYLAIATCEVGGKPDETIMAAVRVVDQELYEEVLWAQRYDMGSGKFIEVSSAGIRCGNEGYGLP